MTADQVTPTTTAADACECGHVRLDHNSDPAWTPCVACSCDEFRVQIEDPEAESKFWREHYWTAEDEAEAAAGSGASS